MHRNKIQNPKTGRWVSINGSIGQQIQREYNMRGGAFANLVGKASEMAQKTPQAKLANAAAKKSGVLSPGASKMLGSAKNMGKSMKNTAVKLKDAGKEKLQHLGDKNIYTLKNIYLMNWEIYRMLNQMNAPPPGMMGGPPGGMDGYGPPGDMGGYGPPGGMGGPPGGMGGYGGPPAYGGGNKKRRSKARRSKRRYK
jgi:hypothetical protein